MTQTLQLGGLHGPAPGAPPLVEVSGEQVFFGGEYGVLRGGSWVTEALVWRATFRKWDLPQRRQIFAGIRCARDA